MEEEKMESTSVSKKSNNEFEEVGSIAVQEEPKVNTESNTESYFDGTLLELMAYNYLCMFITAITAGVCRPWGLSMLNKYIYSHTVISGKRLKFEGQGDELFAKTFRWNFFRLVTFGIYSIWVPTKYKEWEVSNLHFEDEQLVRGDSYFTGTVGAYFGINLLTWLITIVSFGLLSPVAHVIKLKWELEHMIINKKVVVFKGSAGAFFLKKITWLLLSGVTFGIYALWIPLKTLRWDYSNTFLLRKGDNSTRPSVSIDKNGVVQKKETNKAVMYTIIGVAAIFVIVLIVKLIGWMQPSNPAIEEEIVETYKEAREEFRNMSEHPLAKDSTLPKNIKKLNMDTLNKYIQNGGKGWYSNYASKYDENGEMYAKINITMVKKSTICRTYISKTPGLDSYGPSPDCMSIREFIGGLFGIKAEKSNSMHTMPLEEY